MAIIGGAIITGLVEAGSAVGAAAASAGTAIAGVSVGTALEVASASGLVLSTVGAVTGNKALLTAGLVLGGIGGVGALASAAGLIDSSAALFGDAAAAGADIPAAVAITPEVAGVGGADLAGAGADVAAATGLPAGSTNIVDALAPAVGDNPDLAAQAATVVSPNAVTGTPAVADTSAGVVNGQSPLLGQVDANAAANAIPPSAAQVPQAAQQAGANIPGMINVTPNQITGNMAPGQLADALNGVGSFAKENPLVTYGLLQAAGGLASGFSPLSAAQTSLANAQAANNRAAASLTQQQVANINSGQPVATRIPQQVARTVTGAPIGGGLINQTPGAAVSGVPA